LPNRPCLCHASGVLVGVGTAAVCYLAAVKVKFI
jgi:hypothetical protein